MPSNDEFLLYPGYRKESGLRGMRRRHDGRWPGSQGSPAQLHHFPMHDLRAIGEVYLRGVISATSVAEWIISVEF